MSIDFQELEFTSPIKCYNGAFDSKTQRVMEAQDRTLKLIRSKEPGAWVTYFPLEEQYIVHVYGRELSCYTSTRGSALADAYNRLFTVHTIESLQENDHG